MNDNPDVRGIALAMFWCVLLLVLFTGLDVETATVGAVVATVILTAIGAAGRENEYGPRGR